MVEAPVLSGMDVMTDTSGPARRVLVLADRPPGLAPGQRFRFEQWAPHLARDHAITLDLVPFESPGLAKILHQPGHRLEKIARVAADFARRSRVVAQSKNYDAVMIVREASLIGPAFYEKMVASRRPTIFDFDDAIWSNLQGKGNGLFSRLHFYRKTSTLCRIATAVTPGNQFLADYARKQNSNVTVIPTSIELDDYPLVDEPASDMPFVVCWTGSTSTLVHFNHARDALEALAKKIPLVVKVICNVPPMTPIKGAEMRFVPWSQDREAAEIGACHVGIMPLPDDDVSRGKCGLKALQYMATGRPVVVSPVGMNRDLVRDGENGFLAANSQEFVDALLRLAESRELRRRLGAAARKTIEQDFSAEVVSARFARVIRSVTD